MANAKIVNTPSQAIPCYSTTHHQNTVSSAAENIIDFTLNANTTHVLVQFTGANCRVTLDGATSPTSSLGFVYVDGSTAYWTRLMALAAKGIRDDSTDVICEIQELSYL